jgi:C-terminal processing protease CtpA/Prc
MNRRTLLAVLVAGIGIAAPLVIWSGHDEETSADSFVADIRHLTQLLTDKWGHRELRESSFGVVITELEREAISKIQEDGTKTAFLDALTVYVSALQDGHASLSWDRIQTDEPNRLPVALAQSSQGVVVCGVSDALAESTDVRRGDLLVAIDGKPIEEVLAEIELRTFASSPDQRRRRALRSLDRKTSRSEVAMTLRHTAETPTFEAHGKCPPKDEWFHRGGAWSTRPQTRMLEEGVGYFRPGTFYRKNREAAWSGASSNEKVGILEPDLKFLHDAIDEMAGVKVLILDLRGNPGGTDILGKELAGILLGEGADYYKLDVPGRSWWPASSHPVRAKSGQKPFPGALICLIDCTTFSVADNFAACLKDRHPDVTFVGRPTGAGTGAPRTFELPRTKVKVGFCTMMVYSPDGRVIEGTGTLPDVPTEWAPADFAGEADPDLIEAWALAHKRL